MRAPTTATFHLTHSSQEPLELSVKMPSLAMAIVHRDAIAELSEKWAKAIGVYVLLGAADDGEHDYRAYVGKSETGGLRQRLSTHRHSATWEKSHQLGKDWWRRALIVRSRDEDGFNSAEAGWLEGRLWDILDSAPAAKLVGKKGDDQTLPKHQRDELEQFVPAITAVLRAIGASPDTPDQEPTITRPKKHNATVGDLVEAELLTPGARLRSIPSLHEAIAVVKTDGQLEVAGVSYDSPSGAAVAVAGHEINGWKFWGVPSGEGTLIPLAQLRERLQAGEGEPATPEEESTPTKPLVPKASAAKPGALKPLVDAGLLESGAVLFAVHQGQRHEATVDDQGVIHLRDGTIYTNPSAAAVSITGHETNGWMFWRTTIENKNVRLRELRDQTNASKPASEARPNGSSEQ
jgi:hypothetical protein